jgi:hypothetical protein
MTLSQIIPLKPLFLLISMTDQVSYTDKDNGHVHSTTITLVFDNCKKQVTSVSYHRTMEA